VPETLRIETYWKYCNDFSGKFYHLSGPIDIPFGVYDVGVYGSLYTEKWILTPGRHYLKYLYSVRPPSIPHSGVGVPLPHAERTVKSYSGDVTGTLGEGLTVIALTKAFLIDFRKISLLRPIKGYIKCPDFIIYDLTPALYRSFFSAFDQSKGLFKYTKSNSKVNIPHQLPVECKSSVTLDLNSSGSQRVIAAMEQLNTFWENDYRNVRLQDRWGLISIVSLGNAPPLLFFIFVIPPRGENNGETES